MAHPAHVEAHHDGDDYSDHISTTSPHRRSHEDDVEAQKPKKLHVHIQEPGPLQHQGTGDLVSPTKIQRSDTSVPKSPSIKSLRRRGRAATGAVNYEAHEMGRSTGWHPGAEPGFDTSDPAPPYSQIPGGDVRHPEQLHQKCGITVVDYSSDYIVTTDLDNDNLEDFLNRPQEDWVVVRWINVDGLSWDVIRLLGNYKGLHRLAIEDLMNTKNRTKVDWYHDHTFMILPLQKLVNIMDGDDDSDDDAHVTDLKISRAAFNSQVLTEKQRRRHGIRKRRKVPSRHSSPK
jgi:hypothetical protein